MLVQVQWPNICDWRSVV